MKKVVALGVLVFLSLQFLLFVLAQNTVPTSDSLSLEEAQKQYLFNKRVSTISLILVPLIGTVLLARYKKTIISSVVGYYLIIGILIIAAIFQAIRLSDDVFGFAIVIAIAVLFMLPFHYLNKREDPNNLELWAGHLSTLGHLIIITSVVLEFLSFYSSYQGIPILGLPFYVIALPVLGSGVMKRRKRKKY